jgi:ATPase family associated with various cellular activities (AAA)
VINEQENWVDPFRPLRPESLDDYRLLCHFSKRPMFILKYSGSIKLMTVQKGFGKKLIHSVGVSAFKPKDKNCLEAIPESFLIQLCRRSFVELTPTKIRVFAESHALAVKQLNLMVSEFAMEKQSDIPQFHLVTCDRVTGYFETVSVKLTNEQFMDEPEMNLHYGEDFPEWHRQLVNSLSSQNRGITIFRGKPGTGKTTYLRKLMVALHKSHFFLYMPMKIGWMLNAPETVQFWVAQKQQNPNRKLVVILEDAEHFLMERGSDNASSASDLINAGDGLLGNFLQLHLICTVNCDVDRLDKAVTRPGRMVAYREFARLTPAQAQKLATSKNLQIKQQDSYSLAEIYNGSHQLEGNISQKKIGFTA